MHILPVGPGSLPSSVRVGARLLFSAPGRLGSLAGHGSLPQALLWAQLFSGHGESDSLAGHGSW